MNIFSRFFKPSPFVDLHEHTKKVHECVELLRPLTQALVAEDYGKIEDLHNLMSKTEHEADQIKDRLRDEIVGMYILSVGKNELSCFLAYQDDVADAAQDYAVLLLLRKTKIPGELRDDFLAFVNQVINVSEHLLTMAEKLQALAAAAFKGKEAQEVLKAVGQISYEEWQSDRMERRFARKFYGMEDRLGPIDLLFLDKICQTLSEVSNKAEKTAKYLRLLIRTK